MRNLLVGRSLVSMWAMRSRSINSFGVTNIFWSDEIGQDTEILVHVFVSVSNNKAA